jgi:DNA-directed RNA polymerase subunit RPC12/RpoP
MNFKQIASFDNYMLANMTLGMLQENEVTCHLKDENIVTVDPLLNPAVGGIKLLVSESDFEKAKELIKKAEEDYVKDIACPNCKVHALTVEEIINRPADFWGILKNKIAYGQSSTYRKQYRCTNCNRVFTELPLSF